MAQRVRVGSCIVVTTTLADNGLILRIQKDSEGTLLSTDKAFLFVGTDEASVQAVLQQTCEEVLSAITGRSATMGNNSYGKVAVEVTFDSMERR